MPDAKSDASYIRPLALFQAQDKGQEVTVEVLKKYLKDQAGKLCTDCQRRAEKNPLRVLDCKVESCRQIISGMPAMQDWLCDACQTNLAEIEAGLKKEKVDFNLDKYLVRGFFCRHWLSGIEGLPEQRRL